MDRSATDDATARIRSWIPANLVAADPVALLVLGIGIAAIQCAPHPGLRAWMIAGMLMSGGGTVYLWLRGRVTTPQVVVGAVIARLAAFPLGPSVTDDTFRYIWDGWVQLDGLNPYALRPEGWMAAADGEVADRYRDLYEQLNSASYFSVYPPVSQLIFAAGGGVDAILGQRGDVLQSYYAIKAAFLTLEIGAVACLARMMPARALVLYAWSPLVILETAGQGHTEAALVAFLVGAVWAVRERRAWVASVALAGAAMVKLYPVLLFPLLWRRFGWAGLWPGIVAVIGLSAPYAAWFVPPHVFDSLNLYVRLFEFFAGPYFAVKHLLLTVTGTDFSKVIGPVFRAVFLAGVPAIYLVDAWRNWRIERSMLWILGGFLALSTTVHPWYLLGVLPLVCLRLGRGDTSKPSLIKCHLPLLGWVWLTVIAPATYGYYTGLPYWTWVWIGWGGAALFAGYAMARDPGRLVRRARIWLEDMQRRRSREKAARIHAWLPEHSAIQGHADRSETNVPVRVLDLGAGEGFVGEAIAAMGRSSGDKQPRYAVRLCDVADLNRTPLPHDTYDGETLPYDDGQFDAVVLYFVLHHCEAPGRVLSEALRVASQRVIVVESVVTGPVQHRLLRAADIAVNRIREGGSLKAQEQHLSFRSAESWKTLAEEKGATVTDITCWPGRIHPQTRLVLEPAA